MIKSIDRSGFEGSSFLEAAGAVYDESSTGFFELISIY
jgi:hypothetical protein